MNNIAQKENTNCINDENNTNNIITAKDICCKKTKHREALELSSLQNRLKRVEGQVRGIQKMLDNDAYCTDILTQVAAIQAALNAFNRQLLENHIRTCVVEDIVNGDDEVVTDLVKTIQKLMK